MKHHRIIWFVAKYATLTAGGILLYLCAAKYALAERGYRAVGGEVFFLLLPVLYYIVATMVRDLIRDIKKGKKR